MELGVSKSFHNRERWGATPRMESYPKVSISASWDRNVPPSNPQPQNFFLGSGDRADELLDKCPGAELEIETRGLGIYPQMVVNSKGILPKMPETFRFTKVGTKKNQV